MMRKQGKKLTNGIWSAKLRKYIGKELINILIEKISQLNKSADVKQQKTQQKFQKSHQSHYKKKTVLLLRVIKSKTR